MENLQVQNSITINAAIEKVWNILVNPEETPKYMFGCKTISDWKVGSTLLWSMLYEGKDFIPVKGIIKAIEAPHMLLYTVIDPHAEYADIPENYLNVKYELKAANGTTILTVTQDGFETVADGEKRYKDVHNNGDGWNPILVQIKSLAEKNML